MRTLGDAAFELPWLAPCAGSLVALTREPASTNWSSLRGDPGLVLLLLRGTAHIDSLTNVPFHSAALHDPAVLELALNCLDHAESCFVDWHDDTLLPLYKSARAMAHAAEAIARETGLCPADNAWAGGLLAPLGWLLAAVNNEPCSVDCPALARRLAARWQLPRWISAVAGHLALPVGAAGALGVQADYFMAIQLAVVLAHKAELGCEMPVGTPTAELIQGLGLSPATVKDMVQELKETSGTLAPPRDWRPPSDLELLPQLLRLAIQQRQRTRHAECEKLQTDLDALHDAVRRQHAGEEQRLGELKLRALAELAAGAGHEINNPLAVISGQAQYLLSAEQEPSRRKSLQTIVGQTQRIHQTLTQLMQFARPPAPRKQHVDLQGLLRDVVGGLQGLADERQVRLISPETPTAVTLNIDAGQIHAAITALLRNAIEAAPPNGWASLAVHHDSRDGACIVVEDSGPGLTPGDREHLFDPFYSGRRAGRGRGLGLPTAWQLARQHGGEVQFISLDDGPTRFQLSLPADAVIDTLPLSGERQQSCNAVAQSA